jgi:hypothetical protein
VLSSGLSGGKGVSNPSAADEYVWELPDIWMYTWLLQTADDLKIAKLELETWGRYGTITIVSDAPSLDEINFLIFASWTQSLFELQAAA